MTYYNSLSAIANPKKLERVASEVPPEARELYNQRAADLSREVKEAQLENRLSERELTTILPWMSIQEMYRAGRGELDPQERLLADMYLCCYDVPEGAPRRLDYGEVRIFKNSRDAEMYASAKGEDEDGNYIVLDRSSGKATLVLRNFKTFRHYGEYRCELPGALAREVFRSVRADPREYLFYKHCGSACKRKEPLRANTFGVRLSATMEKLTGKAIGVSNLRKSFITWLYNCNDKSEKELLEYASAMGHSTDMARLYRKINIDQSVAAAEEA
jgi:integrase